MTTIWMFAATLGVAVACSGNAGDLEIVELVFCTEEMGAVERHGLCMLDRDRQALFERWNELYPESTADNPFYPPEPEQRFGLRIFVGYVGGEPVAGARLIEMDLFGERGAYIEYVRSRESLFLPTLLRQWKARYPVLAASVVNPRLKALMSRGGFVDLPGESGPPISVWRRSGERP